VDAYIHGCPPTAEQIWSAVSELLQGRMPALSHVYLRYG
jgi:coenzyme F420-reducing hydrogenase gamma subunit